MENHPQKIALEIPLKTYLVAAGVALLIYLVIKLAPILLLLLLSLLMAVTLSSLSRFLMSKGWKRRVADSFLIFILFSILAGLFFFVIPEAFLQMKELMHHLPQLQHEMTLMAPVGMKERVNSLFSHSPDSINKIWSQFAIIANQTLVSLFNFAMMVIVSVYMFLDGKRSYRFVRSFFSRVHQKKIDATVDEIIPIVEAYVIGQATTSTIAAIWVFTAAYFLNIPGALTLAVLAAAFDILPGIGFVLNVLTAGILGLTVSFHTAILMVLSLMVYSALENYILVPSIYGRRMKLSPLVVLVSLILSGGVGGIIAMIVVLPVVAAYKPIEKHWLKRSKQIIQLESP